jgi:hypothetical protein
MTGAESFRLNAIANGNMPRTLPPGWDLAKVNDARAGNGHEPVSTLDRSLLQRELFACHRGVVTLSPAKDDVLVDGAVFNSWARAIGRSDNQQQDVAKIRTADGGMSLIKRMGISRLFECFTGGVVNTSLVPHPLDSTSFHIFVNQYRYVDKAPGAPPPGGRAPPRSRPPLPSRRQRRQRRRQRRRRGGGS